MQEYKEVEVCERTLIVLTIKARLSNFWKKFRITLNVRNDPVGLR